MFGTPLLLARLHHTDSELRIWSVIPVFHPSRTVFGALHVFMERLPGASTVVQVLSEADTALTLMLAVVGLWRTEAVCRGKAEGVGKVRGAFSEEVTCEQLESGEASGWGGKESGSCRRNSMYKGLEAKHCGPTINL